jgi:hypothetical protein
MGLVGVYTGRDCSRELFGMLALLLYTGERLRALLFIGERLRELLYTGDRLKLCSDVVGLAGMFGVALRDRLGDLLGLCCC